MNSKTSKHVVLKICNSNFLIPISMPTSKRGVRFNTIKFCISTGHVFLTTIDLRISTNSRTTECPSCGLWEVLYGARQNDICGREVRPAARARTRQAVGGARADAVGGGRRRLPVRDHRQAGLVLARMQRRYS